MQLVIVKFIRWGFEGFSKSVLLAQRLVQCLARVNDADSFHGVSMSQLAEASSKCQQTPACILGELNPCRHWVNTGCVPTAVSLTRGTRWGQKRPGQAQPRAGPLPSEQISNYHQRVFSHFCNLTAVLHTLREEQLQTLTKERW